MKNGNVPDGTALSNTSLHTTFVFADYGPKHRALPSERHRSPLAPADYDPDKLPDPFRDGDDPRTVQQCRRAYRRIVATNHADPETTSKIDRAERRYRKLLQADRLLQQECDLTTVLITLRPHPLDEYGRVVEPLALDRAVFAAKAEYPFRRKLAYQLRDRLADSVEYEYATVVAGTRGWATPHLHGLIYADDPANRVDRDMVDPVLRQLVEDCPLAYPEHHDPGEGAIRIEHDPPVAADDTRDDVDTYADRPATAATTYLASQLPHFALKSELENGGPRADPWQIDAAVTAWASPHQWFQVSRGINQISNIQLS